jgi:high-affinity K+ transport system ATPase subunit B
MRITHLTPDEAIASLRSHAGGLSAAEGQRRLAEYGPNRVEEMKGEPLALRFLREFIHFFALILWLAAGLAFVADFYDPALGMATLGWAIVGVIAVNGAFSFWQEYRAERAIAALKRLLPHQVTALRDGAACLLPAEALVPGDVVLVGEGENVPADCRLVEAFAVRVNLATITGESLPKARTAAATTEDDLLRAPNVLLAGSTIVAGEGKALVFATGMHTEFGKIARLTQAGDEPPSPLQREITRLSRLVAVLATALGVVFFLVGRLLGLSFWENFIFAIGIIVANVPEGLLPTVTLSLAMATQRMARRKALIRHLPAVEALGAATVICTDKTGTLTENRMSVKRLFVSDGLRDPAQMEPAAVARHAALFEAAALCHNVRRVTENGAPRWLGDPMEVALVEMAERAGAAARRERSDEVPFDADRRRMSTVHAGPSGLVLYCKGAPEAVLPLCRGVLAADGIRALTGEVRAQYVKAQEEMAAAGLRVLAFASRALPENTARERWEEELVLAGLIGLEDPPRPEVPAAIEKCRAAGIRVIMVTGDHPHTARAIAREIGHDPARRQFREHRERDRGGAVGLPQHPQIPHLHPLLEHSRDRALSRLRGVPDPAAAHHHPDPGGGSRHRHGPRARARRGEAGPRHDARAAAAADRAPARLAASCACLSLPRHHRGGRGDGCVLLRAEARRLGIRSGAREARAALPAGDHGLPRRDRGDTGRERLSVPASAHLGVRVRAPRQPAPHLGHRHRDRARPRDRLHPMGQPRIRDRADRSAGLAVYRAVCGGDARARGGPQGARPAPRCGVGRKGDP